MYMREISLHFQVNQPCRLRTYRFFDINQNHDYFDEYQNNYWINRLSERAYIPMNKIIGDLIEKYGEKVHFSMSICGSTIKLFKDYAPEVLSQFKSLVSSGNVELVGSTFTHSLVSLHSKEAFVEQVKIQEKLLLDEFGVKPTSFCNTEIIYSDEIGEWLYELGYDVVLTEGARHLLGWRNPGFQYCNPYQIDQKLMLRNYLLCDDITLRFTDPSWEHYPLSVEKYLQLIENQAGDAPHVNLFFDYETFGDVIVKEYGIFDFFSCLIEKIAQSSDYKFITPKIYGKKEEERAILHVPFPISCSGEEKDTNEWLGNELQAEAFDQLFQLEELYQQSNNEVAKLAWLLLQNAFHYNFMSTRYFSTQANKHFSNMYPSPYQAFINYMNVLNDVKIQLQKNTKSKIKK